MVVGNGLIAKTIKSLDSEDVIFFSSGVSNSNENSDEEFEREVILLKSFVGTNKRLIYFSSFLIFYPCKKNKKYVKHKLRMESFIQKNFNRYLILRLPNVLSHSKNKFTFFNFIVENLNKNQPINVENLSTRYFIDIDHLPIFISEILSYESTSKKILNLSSTEKVYVKDLIIYMKDKLVSDSKIDISNEGCDIDVEFLTPMKLSTDDNLSHVIKLIDKYL